LILPVRGSTSQSKWKIRWRVDDDRLAWTECDGFAALTQAVGQARQMSPDAELYIIAPSDAVLDHELRVAAALILHDDSHNPTWAGPPLSDVFFGGLRNIDHLYARRKRARRRRLLLLNRVKDDSGPRDVWLTYWPTVDPRLEFMDGVDPRKLEKV
jgi:hypothetical protein